MWLWRLHWKNEAQATPALFSFYQAKNRQALRVVKAVSLYLYVSDGAVP